MRASSAVLIAASATAWTCWLVSAPALAAAEPSRTVTWAAGLTYRTGAVICHQQDARSLHLGGVRMPVCARCFGLYAGGAIGSLLSAAWLLTVRRPAGGAYRLELRRWRWIVLASGLPTLAAWFAEHLGGVAVPGTARALLAIPLGAAVAAIVTLWAGGAAFDDTGRATALDC